jgi:WD repeat-containing protein 55
MDATANENENESITSTSGDEDYNEQDDYVSGSEDESIESSDDEMHETKEESPSTSDRVEKRVIDDYDPEAEEDEVVKKILTELKKPRSKPPNITTEDFPTDLSFHPERNILAVGTVVGDILVYKYSNDENTLLSTHEVHSKAIRDIEFSIDGKDLYSAGRDKSIMITDMETGKLKRLWEPAHDDPIYTLTVIDENLIASGDDEGMVKLWDVRTKGSEPIFSIKKVEDYISSIITNDQKKLLLCTSGDGYLTTINIGQKKMQVQSESYEEELTCAGLYRSESKLVVGTSKGNFYVFNWNEFGYHNDAFSGPLSPISFMIPITEHICVTAGEEGIVRAMHLVPGRVLGIVGQHSLGIEAIDICSDGEYIASSSHDNDIKFWNIKYFEDFNDIKYNEKPNKKAAKHNLPSSLNANRSDFFADLA